MTDLKNPIESFNSRLDAAEERIGELEHQSLETAQSKEQKEK